MQNLKNNLRMFFSEKKNVYITVSCMLLAVMTVLVGSILVFNFLQSEKRAVEISEEEKIEILSEVVKNNPSGILTKPSGVQQGPVPVGNPDSPEVPTAPINPNLPNTPQLPDPEAVPDLNEYNYRTTKTSYTSGPSSSICKLNYEGGGNYGYSLPEDGNYSTEYTEFFDLNNSYYKFKTVDKDQDLLNYTLTHYSNTKNEHLEYRGGNFGIVRKYKANPIFSNRSESREVPTPGEELPLENSINRYFGTNVKIKDLGFIDGKEVLEINYSYEVFCNNQDPYLYIPGVDPIKPENLINISLIDKKTFEVIKRESYLNSVVESNLMSREDYIIERQKVSFSSVRSAFEFEFDKPLRLIDYTNLPEYTAKDQYDGTINYLAQTNLDLPFPTGQSGYNLSWLYTYDLRPEVQIYEYLKEREFYLPGPKGDLIFEKFNDQNSDNLIKLNMIFRNNLNKYFNISIYSEGIEVESVLEVLKNNKYTRLREEDISVNINGMDIPAKKVEIDYEYIYPSSFPVSYPANIYTNQNILFEYNGTLSNLSRVVNNDSIQYLFTTLNTQDPVEFKIIKERIFSLYYYNYLLSYPVSYPNL